MANVKPVEPDQEIEPDQENVNFEEARGLPNPEMNYSNVMTVRPLPCILGGYLRK